VRHEIGFANGDSAKSEYFPEHAAMHARDIPEAPPAILPQGRECFLESDA
jgi:hypothetical protein